MNSAEARQVSQVTTRLLTKFPTASPEVVESAVEEAVAHFTSGRIRDFVPLLIERTATAKLASVIET
ncbi:three-helix bundle dimerization domain-containing protein [Rhodococcus sp. NPDC059968]|uniref:three-helix bundle dimerization domain-containing protein n=1 Tax=Rhodococcus sp. NPDC059968 TaxID=3347017 RepID=UPI0036726404